MQGLGAVGENMCGNIWTVGHSNHDSDHLIGLLATQEIAVVADVRSRPFSRFSPQFNQGDLQAALAARGLRYAFFGDTLGGRPDSDDCYDDEGHVLYDRVAASAFFRAGLERLERGVRRGHRVALLCSEEDPAVCHRHLLVGRVLAERGYRLRHLRGDGRVQTDADIAAGGKGAAGAGAGAAAQASLFGPDEPALEEAPLAWRSPLSIRSASPALRPSTSSGA